MTVRLILSRNSHPIISPGFGTEKPGLHKIFFGRGKGRLTLELFTIAIFLKSGFSVRLLCQTKAFRAILNTEVFADLVESLLLGSPATLPFDIDKRIKIIIEQKSQTNNFRYPFWLQTTLRKGEETMYYDLSIICVLGLLFFIVMFFSSRAESTKTPIIPSTKKTYLLIHGAWHGAWCWERVMPLLMEAGHKAVAIDLPGFGLNAKLPESFVKRPFDPAVFATEPSPVRGVTLQEYADKIMRTIDTLLRGGSGPVVLVGHSMGGIPITLVGEMVPEKIKKIVYLAACMPESNVPPGKYIGGPINEGSPIPSLGKADPNVIGALRLDPRSNDPDYCSTLKMVFYGDVDDATFRMATHFLTPDLPVQPEGTPIKTTKDRWGSIKRVYIKTSRDYAVRPALQQFFIDKADAIVPKNKTDVFELDTDHSPFFSNPEGLAKILIEIAEK